MSRRKNIVAAAAASLSFLTALGSAQSQDPVQLDALETQETVADILDTYERIFKTYQSDLNPISLSRIEQLRGHLFTMPVEDLDVMGQTMGSELHVMKQVSRRQAKMLLFPSASQAAPTAAARDFRTAAGNLSSLSTTDFPTLRTDVPEYPEGGQIRSSNVSEAEVEDVEKETEDQETDRENDDLSSGGSLTGLLCEKMALPDGRANRLSAGERFLQLDLLIGTRIANAIAQDLCDQTVVVVGGGNCSACCIVASVLTEVQQGLYEATELCEDFVDGAEVEAAYHNTLSIFAGVEHIHGDLQTHDVDMMNQLTAHNMELENHHIAISNQLSVHDANISTQLAVHDTDVKALLGTTQATLDNEVEQRRVHLDVVQLQNKKEYLVTTTEAGKPVDVEFESIQVSKTSPVDFIDASGAAEIISLGVGLYQLVLSTPPAQTDLILIGVRHDDVVDHFGQVVFHRLQHLSQ